MIGGAERLRVGIKIMPGCPEQCHLLVGAVCSGVLLHNCTAHGLASARSEKDLLITYRQRLIVLLASRLARWIWVIDLGALRIGMRQASVVTLGLVMELDPCSCSVITVAIKT